MINKEDFEEGKPKDIVTARATPIKANALAKKNLTTARKLDLIASPTNHISSFADPNNPSNVYYQIINHENNHPTRVLSQTY